MLTVADFECIRREVLVQGKSQRKVLARVKHARKTVTKALQHSSPRLSSATPATAPDPGSPHSPDRDLLEEYRQRKQRHTGTRIFKRLRRSATIPAAPVRCGATWRSGSREVFFPLCFDPGRGRRRSIGGEAWCVLNAWNGRSSSSAYACVTAPRPYVRAYLNPSQCFFNIPEFLAMCSLTNLITETDLPPPMYPHPELGCGLR